MANRNHRKLSLNYFNSILRCQILFCMNRILRLDVINLKTKQDCSCQSDALNVPTAI